MKWFLIGNSHTGQFHIQESESFSVVCKMGASIKGLTNPNSTLRLHEDIQTILQNSPDSGLLFFLGQVDVEFGYYYKCVMDGIQYPIGPYIDDLIQRYVSYLSKLPTKTAVITINPTTIRDMSHTYRVCFQDNNGVNGLYSSITNISYESIRDTYLNDSYETRMTNCKLFNDRLQMACQSAGIPCIYMWDDIVVNGAVRPEYMPAHNDHHLCFSNTMPLRDRLVQELHSLMRT